ncbi:outer dynein arm-docking complex subunit 4 isoform X2 [Balaenoptera acutorostrata]|uniref:Outer dynein arm-docking complex subunit 4 n=1 Tax=Balaenoptera acutorostrata TaxID=9767 RepID=A0A383ZRH2_BALAC|nr:outer dynein arm-docking complex subunit 4 isoform X2 [Balaenoptera acutorostrata]
MADPETEGLRSTFPSYMAEGERLYLCGEFAKAAHSFSNALHLQNGDKNCLVARSKCFLKMGELEKSLADAEASLQGDPTFCKGILQKAETLYTMGDFEFALVFYHRGYKLRPDRKFKVGIQKAQEAINNSVGSPSSIKLENKGELSFLSKQAESMQAQQKPHPMRQLVHHPKRESKRKGSLKSEKIIRQLLGELYVDKEYLEKLLLDEVLTSGSAEGSLQKAEKVLKKVLEWSKEEVPNKDELVGNLHSCIGNAQIELGQMVAALQSHRKDLEIAKEYDLPDAKSRALDNIGRVFARVGKFQQAIDTWEEKIPLAKTTLEKTWLFHEIGRCYLELDQAWQAQNYGEKSQQCAEEEGDIEWQLNASVLVAQAQVKLRDFESAVNNFEKALERAKLVHNNQAQQAIINALDDANKGIIEELKKTNYREILKDEKEKENATTLDSITVMAKEKETMKRMRDEPEKVMKQWEWEQMESEKETEGDLSKETLGSTASGPEEHTQRGEVEKASPSRRKGPAVMEGGPGDVAKGQSGEAGRKLTEVNRGETREIYKRPSELDQNLSEESSTRESEGLEKTLSEIGRRGSEALGKTELGEIREPEITENSEKIEKDEKEDE